MGENSLGIAFMLAIPIMIMAILFDYLMSVIEKRLSRHAK